MSPPSSPGSNPGPLIAENSRRRDKRRHTPRGLVIENPLTLLQLAIQTDGTRFLHEPLELGRLHAFNDDEFERVVQQLSQPMRNSNSPPPTKPLTPIILSGLLQRDRDNSSGIDYVNHVRLMRSQALKQEKRSKQHQLWRSVALVLVLTVSWMVYVHQSIIIMQRNISTLGYLGTSYAFACHQLSTVELQNRCHARDALVWAKLRDYPLHLTTRIKNLACHKDQCPSRRDMETLYHQIIPGRPTAQELRLYHAPYSLHTLVTQGIRKLSTKSRSHIVMDTPLRWLGDSRLAQLVRPHVGRRRRILEVGSGIGSWLYALSSDPRNYTGLELSPAAIAIGTRLAKYHELGDLHDGIEVRQQSLHDFLSDSNDQEYDVILAIESLSHETTMSIRDIIEKFTKLLKLGGKLIIVDDVLPSQAIASPYYALPDRQLITHYNLTYHMGRAGLDLKFERDLGLEFTLPHLETPTATHLLMWNTMVRMALSWIRPITRRAFPAFHHLVLLWEHGAILQYANHRRAVAHQKGDLMYVMLVATKAQVFRDFPVQQQHHKQQPQQCNSWNRQPQQCVVQQCAAQPQQYQQCGR